NTYSGNTFIQAGTVQMAGTNAWNPALNGPGFTSIQSGQLILNYATETTPADTVKTKLHDSYVSGFTSGQFRAPAADARRGLGWVDDGGASKVTIAFTYYGDANLDKAVNSTDFTVLAQNFKS